MGSALVGLAAVVLAAIAYLGFRERWLIVRAEGAVVEAPVVRVPAPASGLLEPREIEPVLAYGTPFATLRVADGRDVALTSPCECALVSWLVEPGQPVVAGEPVALFATVDRPLVVRASVSPPPPAVLRSAIARRSAFPMVLERWAGASSGSICARNCWRFPPGIRSPPAGGRFRC